MPRRRRNKRVNVDQIWKNGKWSEIDTDVSMEKEMRLYIISGCNMQTEEEDVRAQKTFILSCITGHSYPHMPVSLNG